MPDTLRDIQATVTNTKGIDILLQIAAVGVLHARHPSRHPSYSDKH